MAAATEHRHPSAGGLHRLTPEDALSHLLEAQLASATCLRVALPALARAAAVAAAALERGGKLAYAGAGSSGLMALADCLELAGTFGIPPARTPILFAGGAAALLHMTGGVEDDPALAAADLQAAGLRAGDAVVCVSASGTTPYTLAVARGAQLLGGQVVGLANVPGSALLSLADVAVVLDTGAEVVSGSTRMAAGTAQKIALNLFSTLVGMTLGHVHDGYMVNVQADNAKLRDRAARMVAAIAQATPEAARAALDQSGGAVKPAVLIAAGAAPQQAAALLDCHAGRLAPALEDLAKTRPTGPQPGRKDQ